MDYLPQDHLNNHLPDASDCSELCPTLADRRAPWPMLLAADARLVYVVHINSGIR
jgi:hypothetical protein